MRINADDISFEHLSSSLNLTSFDCGDDDLNDFLLNDALDNQKVFVSKTRVAYYNGKDPIFNNDGRRYDGDVLGFITLVTDNIEKKSAKKVKRSYRYSHFPALKIARLGVNCNFKRRGIATAMLDLAVLSAISIFEKSDTGCRLITVDSKPSMEALSLYEGHGFQRALKKDYIKEDYHMTTYQGVPITSLDTDDTIPLYWDFARYLSLL